MGARAAACRGFIRPHAFPRSEANEGSQNDILRWVTFAGWHDNEFACIAVEVTSRLSRRCEVSPSSASTSLDIEAALCTPTSNGSGLRCHDRPFAPDAEIADIR